MSLVILDEGGNAVTLENPIITEHNGTTGDTLILPLLVENSSEHHFHRDISIQVSSKPPVDCTLNLPTAPNPNSYSPRIDIHRMNPHDKLLFNLRTVVPQGTPEMEVTGTRLQVTSLRFPVHSITKGRVLPEDKPEIL